MVAKIFGGFSMQECEPFRKVAGLFIADGICNFFDWEMRQREKPLCPAHPFVLDEFLH
jgi:hypothetical protein